MSNSLPSTWAIVSLLDVAPLVPTGVPNFTGEVEYYSTGSVQEDGLSSEGRYTFESRPSRANRWTKPGDVLQARMQGTSKPLLVNDSIADKLFSTGFIQLRPDPRFCNPGFLRHYIASKVFLDDKDSLATGSTQIALTDAGVRGLEIPLAPLNEQRRIVEKLEKLLAKVDVCQHRLGKIPVLLKRFRQSVLAAACSGHLTADWREQNPISPIKSVDQTELEASYLTLPDSWSWTNLKSICEHIVDCPHSTPVWTNSGYICIRTTNFRPGFLDLSEIRYVSEETYYKRIQRLRPEPGDVLYSREGGILGVACIVPPGIKLCLGQRMMLFRVNEAYLAPLLVHWLNGPVIGKKVLQLIGGSASPHLNVQDIKTFPVPFPPLAEQKEIVRRVEVMFRLADAAEKGVAVATARTEKITQAILAKAFRGELVPTEAELARREGRSYETGSQLLARIKSERRGKEKSK